MLPAMLMSGVSPVVVTETDATVDINALTSYTFSSQNFGAASADRIIAVVVMGERNASTGVVTSVTIGGSAATIAVNQTTGASPNYPMAIAYLAVPSGTSGNVVVNFDLAQNMAACWTFAITGASGLDNTSSAIITTNDSLAVSAGAGVVVGGGLTTTTDPTVSGVTQGSVLTDASYRGRAGYGSGKSGTVTATFDQTMRTIVMASFR